MFARSTGGTTSAPAIVKRHPNLMRGALAALFVVTAPSIIAPLSPASAQSEESWGAIYYSPDDRTVGAAWNQATQEGAILRARKICQKYGRNCELATEFQTNECGAIAEGPEGWAADFASSKREAESKALEQCSQNSSSCTIIGIACNNGLGTAWFKKNEQRKQKTQSEDQGGATEESLAFKLQSELKRLNCLSGRVDGKWGPGSRRALARFADQSGLRLDSEPTQKALDAAKSSDATYCRTVTPPRRPRTGVVRKRVRCSRVRFAYSRGGTCACAGGRVFTGRSCVYRRRRR